MTVTQLPANVTVTAATDVAVTDHTVIDGAKVTVHRDKRQTLVNIAALGAVATGAPAVGLVAANLNTASRPLVALSAILSVTALTVYEQIRRDNRKWVYATDVDTP